MNRHHELPPSVHHFNGAPNPAPSASATWIFSTCPRPGFRTGDRDVGTARQLADIFVDRGFDESPSRLLPFAVVDAFAPGARHDARGLQIRNHFPAVFEKTPRPAS